MKTNTPNDIIEAPLGKRTAWEELSRDRELLERLQVTPQELESLRTCALLGTLIGKDDLLFILRTMRGGNTPELTTTIDLSDNPSESDEDLDEADETPLILRPTFDFSSVTAPEPESLAAIVRVRVPEQLGVFALIIATAITALAYFVPELIGWEHHFWSQLGIAPPAPVASASLTLHGPSELRIVLACEAVCVAVALLATNWIYRAPARRLRVRAS